jgi:hypothetical protein
MGYPFGFGADRNTLLPLMNFIENPNNMFGFKFLIIKEQNWSPQEAEVLRFSKKRRSL